MAYPCAMPYPHVSWLPRSHGLSMDYTCSLSRVNPCHVFRKTPNSSADPHALFRESVPTVRNAGLRHDPCVLEEVLSWQLNLDKVAWRGTSFPASASAGHPPPTQRDQPGNRVEPPFYLHQPSRRSGGTSVAHW